jgi:hypothetical protein
MSSLAWAAVNLNSSKSNAYRVTYDATLMSPAQASSLLAELDKIGPADEAKLKSWLAANFKRLGIQGDRIKHISIRRADKASPTLILLLANPADEAAAIAVSDGAVAAPKAAPKQ